MRTLSEAEALARLQRGKAAFQTHVKFNFEQRARDCRACPTPGVCCTDAHFVNVHITRLEAVAIRETIRRTPRLTEDERRAVYIRAREAVEGYGLGAAGDTFAQRFACPLFVKGAGCLVHRRAKPAPCIQHACYDDWMDVPPLSLQWREERRVEQLNAEVYGAAWAWLPLPVWLTLVDPEACGAELQRLAHVWESRRAHVRDDGGNAPRGFGGRQQQASLKNRTLPVLRA
ncbi:MAG TPA: hypothetical protein VHU19_17145 [Pyrinomonadaceae bacterium]|jgi:hypothetical protein|nr:hypothetical protein [Pyrinomonadaceae bacterium]